MFQSGTSSDQMSSFCIQVPSLTQPLSWRQDGVNKDHQIKLDEQESNGTMESEPMMMDSITETERSSDKSSDPGEGTQVESVFHKKFDKMRKHTMASESLSRKSSTESQPSLVIASEHDSEQESMAVEVPNQDLAKLRLNDEVMEMEQPRKKSAVESHPQLLAQLSAPSQNTFQPGFLKLPLKMSPSPPSPTNNQQSMVLNVPKYSGRTSSVAKEMPTLASHLNSVPVGSIFQSQIESNTMMGSQGKDPAHCMALSHLKDRLVNKKYDSSDSLDRLEDSHGMNKLQKDTDEEKMMKKMSDNFQMNPAMIRPGLSPEQMSGIPPSIYQQVRQLHILLVPLQGVHLVPSVLVHLPVCWDFKFCQTCLTRRHMSKNFVES